MDEQCTEYHLHSYVAFDIKPDPDAKNAMHAKRNILPFMRNSYCVAVCWLSIPPLLIVWFHSGGIRDFI